MRKIQFDIQNTIYTVPINPVEVRELNNQEHEKRETLDGYGVETKPFFDSRERLMRWESIDNNTNFQAMTAKLISMEGLDNIRLNLRDLILEPNENQWKDIRVDNVSLILERENRGDGSEGLVYNIDLKYRFVRSD